VSTTSVARLGTVGRNDVLLYTVWASQEKIPACSCICSANRAGSVPKGTTKAKQKSSALFVRHTAGFVLVRGSVIVVANVKMVELLVVVSAALLLVLVLVLLLPLPMTLLLPVLVALALYVHLAVAVLLSPDGSGSLPDMAKARACALATAWLLWVLGKGAPS